MKKESKVTIIDRIKSLDKKEKGYQVKFAHLSTPYIIPSDKDDLLKIAQQAFEDEAPIRALCSGESKLLLFAEIPKQVSGSKP